MTTLTSSGVINRPLVLVATAGDVLGRSLETVLQLQGYSVERAADSTAAIAAVRQLSPDAMFLDESLDHSGIDVCRSLRDDQTVDPSMPVFVIANAPAANRSRIEAYAAGAWEYLSQPLDAESLLLKLATFVRARTSRLAASR